MTEQLLDGPAREQFDRNHAFYRGLNEDSLLKPFRERSGVPAPGEGTSSVAFSLSISTRGSSASIQSPSAFFQAPTVASRMDSPMLGTFTDRAMSQLFPFPKASAINCFCSALGYLAVCKRRFKRGRQVHG